MPMEDQFWGDYFGACKDKYGIGWMINCPWKTA
jgi:PhnB protein